ncbi:hypothetical protein PGT21_025885 [Puccinia graminis f. sp. tritici]|uniref:Uncharacterized protein n=1 Tax=Puccinia graminis f. sp. tritici TaxID=56615 RepID=A0A5B0M237_PUCGR|nr:hypothetical protein PGT21_025885 [Puccinia graminis f. sp. tritici]KAA1132609.1 hypothetical protein PGTUg99_013856 [Puccinia graminis f. sp. tritici]
MVLKTGLDPGLPQEHGPDGPLLFRVDLQLPISLPFWQLAVHLLLSPPSSAFVLISFTSTAYPTSLQTPADSPTSPALLALLKTVHS